MFFILCLFWRFVFLCLRSTPTQTQTTNSHANEKNVERFLGTPSLYGRIPLYSQKGREKNKSKSNLNGYNIRHIEPKHSQFKMANLPMVSLVFYCDPNTPIHRYTKYTLDAISRVDIICELINGFKWMCVRERVTATTSITDFNRLAAEWKIAGTFFSFMFSNQMIILSPDNQCTCTYLMRTNFFAFLHSHALHQTGAHNINDTRIGEKPKPVFPLCQLRSGRQ